jgi:hypothetical protein
MAILTIPTEEQQRLLSKRRKIPPIQLRESLSADGQVIWDNLNFEYHHLHKELEAYFKGLPSQLTGLSDEWRERLEATKQWFLAIYELIRQSWDYLTPYHKDGRGSVLTPGLLAAEILEADCKGSLLPAIAGRVVISPRFNYELPAKIAKAKHRGKNSLNQLTKDCSRKWGEYKKAAALEVAVLSWCQDAATKDEYAKQALEIYNCKTNELNRINQKWANSRKGKDEPFEKGSRKTS